jgi:transcription antitermination factor NusG
VVGDRVIVTSGDIAGLEGSVLKVQDQQILIKPEDQRIGVRVPVGLNLAVVWGEEAGLGLVVFCLQAATDAGAD